MFLHLGGNEVVRNRDVVVILNAENGFLPTQIKPAGVKMPDSEIKAVVITTKGTYYSPISSGTLKKRAESPASQAE